MGQGPSLMLFTTFEQTTLTLYDKVLHNDIELLLTEFEDVFQVLIGLPPIRLQDHRILLQGETQVVKLKPCTYPITQKRRLKDLSKKCSRLAL